MKKPVNDLTGKRFGKLTVLGIDDRGSRRTYYVCACDCGGIKTTRSDALLSGATVSCGCRKKEQDKKNLVPDKRIKHGLSWVVDEHGNRKQPRIYTIWQHMRYRCENPNDKNYPNYGGRGITVCEEWQAFKPFYDWSMSNGYEDNLSIDRRDNDKGYSPDNCRWTTNREQSNNRRTCIPIKIGNTTKTITEWCEVFAVEPKIVMARYHRNPNRSLENLFSPEKWERG